ncbi:MAG TPA: helix-turn-helix transcriptional regulator [Longimicrobium sp.]|jgi:DNA-binding XRE family transcriptional regulator|nr:helix-turn-helix transcriptional regulator [Longimicrobium sp.]
MFDRKGTRAAEVFATIRDEVPGFAEAEREFGSRLVVARNVMRLRIQRGWTQQQLARELGVTQPRVAQIESASENVQIDTLDRLAAVFGVEPAGLLQPGKPSAAPREEPEAEPAVAGSTESIAA